MKPPGRIVRAIIPVLGATLLFTTAGCGGKTAFGLTAGEDNDAAALDRVLHQRSLSATPAPHNAAGRPIAIAVIGGKQRGLVAYDLAADKALWKVDADVQSRISIGRDVIAEKEGNDLVVRDLATGAVTWKTSVGAGFVGAAVDDVGVYLVTRSGNGEGQTWTSAGYDVASGSQRWTQDADGQLGAPVAQGGLVLSPFLAQWLSLLDGKTGIQQTRVRGIDDQISTIRITSDAAYFGSKRGIYRLDPLAATGKRDASTFGTVKLPPQLAKATWGPDLYDKVQSNYSAGDRTRIVWRADPSATGPLEFQDGQIAVHYFRYVFGFAIDGSLRWAYSHPRVELVAAEHAGSAIVAVSAAGEVIALDPKTGALLHTARLGDGIGPIVGASFDADGWQPTATGAEKSSTAQALVAIVQDRDRRFDNIKEFAIASLATLDDASITGDLLAILSDDRASEKTKVAVVTMLAARHDVAGLASFAAALGHPTDFVKGTRAGPVDDIAKIIAGMDGRKADPAARQAAVVALRAHLEAPDTNLGDAIWIVNALAALGGDDARAAIKAHAILYHGDAEVAGDEGWCEAIAKALAITSGPAERETLRALVADGRSTDAFKAKATAALGAP